MTNVEMAIATMLSHSDTPQLFGVHRSPALQ